MADSVKKVRYGYFVVPNRAGQGARILETLREAGVNMHAYSGFPVKGGKAQIDVITEQMATVLSLAKRNGWRASAVKKAFLVKGADRVGACHAHLQKLADAGVNVTAGYGLSAGNGRFGMILWVKPRDYARAARALKAT